ncbi:MAG: outer membrane protein assembly factor BamD [Cytophagales bacterium]|nr:MAG: outer membrane protein assembly factor BamD [Cytophagales bacterium]
MRYLFAVILLTISFLGVQAQSDQELKNSYNYGKKLLSEGKYNNARDIFYKLTQPLLNNLYEKHAYYFYAVSSYKAGDKQVAQMYLQRAIEKFPTFSQIDEVRYLLGVVYFESGTFKPALDVLNAVKQSSLMANIVSTKKHFLYAMPTEQLKNLYNQYLQAGAVPDEVLGKTLAQKLSTERLNAEEKKLLATLSQKYGLSTEQSASTTFVQSTPKLKSSYNIALFLPFMQKETSPNSPIRKYQFVYDMYEGMKIAQKDLEKENVKINLFAFDTERNDTTIQELVKKEWNSEIDLIIGPLYPNNIKPLAKIAEAKKINIVNPLGNDSELIKTNPYIFFPEPTPETQGTKAAEFSISNFVGKNALIYYGNNLQDSLMAFAYKKRIEQEQGYKVSVNKLKNKVGYFSYVSDLDKIAKTDSAHLFVCTDDENKALNIISAIRSSKRGFPILAQRSWLDFVQIPFEKLEQQNVHIIMTDYVLKNKASQDFQREYISRTNIFPSRFAYMGYEMLYYFGKIMAKHGYNFQDALKQTNYEKGKTMAGFNFYNSNDNHCITICKFSDGDFEVINLPLMDEILIEEDE